MGSREVNSPQNEKANPSERTPTLVADASAPHFTTTGKVGQPQNPPEVTVSLG